MGCGFGNHRRPLLRLVHPDMEGLTVITVRGLSDLARKLNAIRMDEAIQDSARVAGARMLSAVQANLMAGTEDAITHTHPPTRGLSDSVGVMAVPNGVIVGTNNRGAPFLELGTKHETPQPFLAPAAMQHGSEAAEAAGQILAQILTDAVA